MTQIIKDSKSSVVALALQQRLVKNRFLFRKKKLLYDEMGMGDWNGRVAIRVLFWCLI